MDKILDNLDSDHKLIEVAKFPGIKLLKNDYHVWLDVDAVKIIATNLADILSKEDPANQTRYKQNLIKFHSKLSALDNKIKAKLVNARNKDYMVTHNAYQYFINHYGLNNAIAITIDHDHNIGARSLLEMQKSIKEHKIQCIFKEPQFDSEIITNLKADSQVKIGELDAEWGPEKGSNKDAYFAMMDALSDSFSECLNDQH